MTAQELANYPPFSTIGSQVTEAPNILPSEFWVSATLIGNCIKGWLDDVSIFNRSLSEREVQVYAKVGLDKAQNPQSKIALTEGTTKLGQTLQEGLVFYMPFETQENYLQNLGPGGGTFVCQKTTKI